MDTPRLDEACLRVIRGQGVPRSLLSAAEAEVRQVAERLDELKDRIQNANSHTIRGFQGSHG